MLTSVVEQVFFVYKACTVNHNYTEEICLHVENYKDIKKEVQVSISCFSSTKFKIHLLLFRLPPQISINGTESQVILFRSFWHSIWDLGQIVEEENCHC